MVAAARNLSGGQEVATEHMHDTAVVGKDHEDNHIEQVTISAFLENRLKVTELCKPELRAGQILNPRAMTSASYNNFYALV